MIPFSFHFSFYRGEKKFVWRDIHTLCLRSCKQTTGAQKIIVHYDVSGEGLHWDEAVLIPGIEWRQADFSTTIHGHPVSDQRIICDLYRLHTLEKEGGFFADLDFVFLGSFETLRHNEAIIGTQCKSRKKLACGLMGSIPGAAFIRAYIEAYKDWTPEEQKKFWKFANDIPWTLSEKYSVAVIPRPAFYPWCWSNKKFLQGGPINTKKSVAMHLWESLHPELTVEQLKTTCVGNSIREILGEGAKTAVSITQGGTLTFN